MPFLFISAGEVVVLLFAALMLFGPDRLPGLVRTVAKGIRTVKNAQADLTQELMSEDKTGVKDIKDAVEDVKSEIEGVVKRKK